MENRDRDHLKLLSVFYYVLGGLSILFGFAWIFYGLMWFGMMAAFLFAAPEPAEVGPVRPPARVTPLAPDPLPEWRSFGHPDRPVEPGGPEGALPAPPGAPRAGRRGGPPVEVGPPEASGAEESPRTRAQPPRAEVVPWERPPSACTPRGPHGGPPLVFFVFMGMIFLVVGVFSLLYQWGLGGCKLYAGWCLAQQKHYMFCLVIGALTCLSVPFGTVLGVFTIVVLMRPSVKELFEAGGPARQEPAST
jgi:hypothetical protein